MRTLRFVLAFAAVVLTAQTASAEKRVAFVVGNSAYVHANPLPNPKNDAADISAALEKLGFTVILGIDLDKRAFDEKLREFARALEESDAGLFFYAGHGVQVGGLNYVLPVDAKLASERDLAFEAVPLEFVQRQMELNREQKTNIMFLDACRDNPLARNLARSMGTRSASVGKGLAEVNAGVGTFVSFSTQPGNVALDGEGRNSPFASALSKRMVEPGRNLNAVMIDVRKDVLAATSGKQVPWDHSALTGEFYFDLAAAAAGLPKSLPQASGSETDQLNERIQKLEAELKRKSDSEQQAKLESLKDRAKEIEVTNREDTMRMFDLRREAMQESDNNKRMKLDREAMNIQMKIAQRGQNRKKLLEQISELEAIAGLSNTETGSTK